MYAQREEEVNGTCERNEHERRQNKIEKQREREAVRVRDVQDSVPFGVLHLGRFDGLDLMF